MVTISEIPLELLEIIFLACVRYASCSPVVLAHVCRLWRNVAHGSARLWTDIDMSSPERAKHYVALSQGAALRVVWFNRSYAVITTSTRDWIWGHAERFAKLELVNPSKVLEHVLSLIGTELPLLSSLMMIAEDSSPALRVSIKLAVNMPALRSLTLL